MKKDISEKDNISVQWLQIYIKRDDRHNTLTHIIQP